jgi:hypothetical protein
MLAIVKASTAVPACLVNAVAMMHALALPDAAHD